MPKGIDELVDLMRLEEIEFGLYRGRNPRSGLQRVFGGQVLAQALAAAYFTVPTERRVHSLHAYFLRPGQYDAPLIYYVAMERDGRTFTTRSVTARQHGKQIFRLSASFKAPEEGLEHQDSLPPGIPGPDECPRLDGGPETERVYRRLGLPFLDVDEEWGVLDIRWVGEAKENSAHPSAQRFWYRTNGTIPDVGTDPVVNQRLHDCILAYLSDVSLLSTTLVTHGVSFSPELTAVSLDHSTWFHRPIRVDDWMLFEQVSPSASMAVGLALGRVFQDGELVSTQAQEGLIRRS
ncbi:acyl-CoA thioesterase [Raineyella fluvialis]|uniref:Acyl-CoA thioesterase 2 n=1 Tax=Raineyella fluvialis TaxID=2662261 RepID=A0A5Q2FDA3_9ACTN|nr:acyl-CoA thioesterase domain-containing protein [Raineyella fluvialis]QGF24789.1 acyl-CoA thioesterase II [Raineyella fluvialis]